MSDLRELYQEIIIDHGRKPRNYYAMPQAQFKKEGFNPLCGDRVTVYLNEKEGVIDEISFQGSGCAISMASSSLMTETLKGKSVAEAKHVFEQFHSMLMNHFDEKKTESLGKLTVLKGVAEFPARIKCATLAWHAMIAALKCSTDSISTE